MKKYALKDTLPLGLRKGYTKILAGTPLWIPKPLHAAVPDAFTLKTLWQPTNAPGVDEIRLRPHVLRGQHNMLRVCTLKANMLQDLMRYQ